MTTKACILAVDDEAFVLDILEDDLHDAGYEVVRAEDGAKALHTLSHMDHCDAIILDRMMPGMDGMAVLRELKSNPDYSNIPVILQTADGQSDHIEETMKAGAYCYLVKPYNEKVLISAIQAAMRSTAKKIN